MKNKRKQRAVLAAACLTATAIVAAGTYAAFMSHDEVTNNFLSLGAKYSVYLVENYTPELDWKSGESIKKEVSVVNSGDVCALVRVSLENFLTLYEYDAETINFTASSAEAGLLVELTKSDDIVENDVAYIQSGGHIVGVWNLNGQYISGDEYVDTNDFTPSADGLYIFKRSDDTYVGYYYCNGKYYKAWIDNFREGSTAKPEAYAYLYGESPYDYGIQSIEVGDTGITVVYKGKSEEEEYDDISFYISIPNLKDDWDVFTDGGNIEMYYKYVLEPGKSIDNFITSVELELNDGSDYFDYNTTLYDKMSYQLRISLDTVQAGMDYGMSIYIELLGDETWKYAIEDNYSGILSWVNQ